MTAAGRGGRRIGSIVTGALLAALLCCSEEESVQPVPDLPRTSLTDPGLANEDLAVYATLFAERQETRLQVQREVQVLRPDSLPVFIDAKPADWTERWRSRKESAVIDCPVPLELLLGFVEATSVPGTLPEGLELQPSWTWIEAADLRARVDAADKAAKTDVAANHQAWIDAYGPEGTLTLSRIAYSADGQWSVVFTDWTGGPMASGFGLRALQRRSDGWHVVAVLPLGWS
jgi:hypothetical protein